MDEPRRLDLRSILTRAETAAPVGVVDAMAAAVLEMLGARDVSFLIADFSGRSLSRLGHRVATQESGSRREETSGRVPLDGAYGAALEGQRPVVLREGADTRVLAPVTSRGEAVGVLELVLPFEPAAITLEDVELAAHQLAYMVIANRRYTDLFEWGQRTVPLSLAAQIQRRLLPASFTCEADQFTLAGWSRLEGWAATRSTSRSTATPCRSRSPTPWGTRSTPHCLRRSQSGPCATRAGAEPACSSKHKPRTRRCSPTRKTAAS